MKNKFLLCACMVALTAAMFTSCKKHTDLTDVNTQVAQKTIPGIYVFIDVDKEKMSTTLYEWSLEKDHTGYYRVASTGNGLDGDTTINLTWSEATMSADGLLMTIPVVVGQQSKELVWTDGVVKIDGYTTFKSVISLASVLRSVNNNLANLTFVFDDTVPYLTIKPDTFYYLAWKTEVVYFTQEQIDDYKQYLIDMADTLAWFNATYPDKAVPDTVRFSTKQQPDQTYKGQISSPYETYEVNMDTTNHGPLYTLNSKLVFDRSAGLVNSGSYYYHEQSWTKECYDDPTNEKAHHTDYIYEVKNALWTPTAFSTIKKFNVTYKGQMTMLSIVEDGGVEKERHSDADDPSFLELLISGFSAADGELTLDEHKYTTK